MKIRRLSIETLEHRRVLAAGGVEAPAWESVIVSLNDNVGNPRAVGEGAVNAHGGQLGHVYEHSIKGFSAQLPPAAIAALGKNPNVKLIEADLAMQAFGQVIPTGIRRIAADHNPVAKINGLDERVDVDIAIIDSGIDIGHQDLNVVGGKHFYTVNSGPPSSRGRSDDNYDDDYGHGTHVAGTAAALDNDIGVVGVAPGARLWAVKVLDSGGSGYVSDIIAGIDWVTARAATIEVANMSLGGLGSSTAYHNAIKASVNAGIVYVVSAGNSGRDILGTDFRLGTSDDTIPAAYPEVATISAIADTNGTFGGNGPLTTFRDPYLGIRYEDDEFADISNFSNNAPNGDSVYFVAPNNVVNSPGLGIDLMMPGIDIYSTYRGGGYATMSGTSMASPHAAGLAALYIAEHGLTKSAAGVYAVRQALIDGGKGWFDVEGVKTPSHPGPTNDSPDNQPERLGWAGSSAPVQTHDVAITSVIATPNPVVLGNAIQIFVELANQGTFAESFEVGVSIAGQSDNPASQNVSLAAGSTSTIVFNWTTTAAGTFQITASAQAVTGETDLADNTAGTSVTVIEQTHDVAVTAINVAPSVVRGESVSVSVQVKNQGTFSETVQVTLTETPNSSSIPLANAQTIASGATATFVFTWTTVANTSLGEHLLTATVGTVSGETNTANNTLTASVTVNEPLPLELIIDDGDSGYVKTTSGWSSNSSGAAYGGDYDSASGGNGSVHATWTFAGLPAGQYQVYATWVSHPKKQATNAPYSVSGSQEPVLVNQRLSPNGSQLAGWQLLTTTNVGGSGNLVVKLTNSANGIVVADAIRVVPVQSSTSVGQSLTVTSAPQNTPAAPSAPTTSSQPARPEGPASSLAVDSYFSKFGVGVDNPSLDEPALHRSSASIRPLDEEWQQLQISLPNAGPLAKIL